MPQRRERLFAIDCLRGIVVVLMALDHVRDYFGDIRVTGRHGGHDPGAVLHAPCVTFNHDNDYPFFKERVKKLEDEGHDPSDWKAACEKAMLWDDTIYTGLFFQKTVTRALYGRPEILCSQ